MNFLKHAATILDQRYRLLCRTLLVLFVPVGVTFAFLIRPFQVHDESRNWEATNQHQGA